MTDESTEDLANVFIPRLTRLNLFSAFTRELDKNKVPIRTLNDELVHLDHESPLLIVIQLLAVFGVLGSDEDAHGCDHVEVVEVVYRDVVEELVVV